MDQNYAKNERFNNETITITNEYSKLSDNLEIEKKLIENQQSEGYSQDNPRSISIQSIDSVAKNQVPKRLKKTFYCSLTLLLLGSILVILGLEEWVRNEDIFSGVSYIVLGCVVIIPGAFYTYQFCKAKVEKDVDNRRSILGEIPEL
jgi:Ca2+-dependent lipid-binding protein